MTENRQLTNGELMNYSIVNGSSHKPEDIRLL
jgi:hypothetical protein